MTPKKIHETTRLSAFITENLKSRGINKIIDLGAGQGYLSHLLVTRAGFQVTAIEGRQHNSTKSTERAKLINKGIKPTGNLENICKFVTAEDLESIVVSESALIGLHTCGDLAANSLRLFLGNRNIMGIINVGCCYQHLTEFANEQSGVKEYLTRLGEGSGGKCLDETLVDNRENAGYPLSQFVQAFAGFFLGRMPRSLCIGESSQQGTKKAILNFKKLEYRAAFQVFLHNYFPDYSKVFMLGNKIRKFNDFGDYCLSALSRMSLNSPMTHEELNQYYSANFEHDEKKISILWLLRSVLSGPLENLIILDRILFLQERGFEAAGVAIFDKRISPRNIAIYAFR
jgi:hypothetical protein